MHRIRTTKGIIALSYITVFYIVETILVHWTLAYLVQATVLNISILLGLYAFRAFDNTTLKSLNSSFISYLSGSLFGSAFSLIIIAFFKYKLPKEVFFLNLFISIFIFSTLSVFIFRRIIKVLPPKRYLVIGREDEIGDILNEVQEKSMDKLQIIGYINPSPATLTTALETEKLFDGILIGDPTLAKEVETTIDKARTKGTEIQFLPNIVEDHLKRIPLEMIDKFKEYYEVAFAQIKETQPKRILDLFISILALIILSPVFLIISICILIEDGRPVFFSQERVGKNGNLFIMHKFRSMHKHSEKDGAKYATEQRKNITKVGRVMRSYRIDEFPQFYDILIGKMSFIGPRPEQPCFVEDLNEELPYYNYRHRLKSGITGWAQTKYKYAVTTEQQKKKLSYDLYYIKNRSIMLDLQIILTTLETVLFRKGAK